jgi:hypothetical protein
MLLFIWRSYLMLPPPQFCDADVYCHRQAKDVFTSMLTTSGLHLDCCCCCAGPGCSSLAYGFGQEIGPYFINPNGTDGLSLNPYAWNTGTSTLIMSSFLLLERICTLINGHHVLQVLDRSDPSLLLTCWKHFCWQR